ncbi:MAG: PilZ domain-containing protein [Desulfuromonadaceae bacterium]
METRKFSRVSFRVAAHIQTGVRRFSGDVENLSMSGMFLVTDERLQMNEPVSITIALTGADPEISVGFDGRVSRVIKNGMAFTFEKMDLDSYTHLKNIVAYNIDDAEKVMEEIYHSIDEKHETQKQAGNTLFRGM